MSKTLKVILKVVRILMELFLSVMALGHLFMWIGALGYEAKERGLTAYAIWQKKGYKMTKEEKRESKLISKELSEIVKKKIVTGIEWISW